MEGGDPGRHRLRHRQTEGPLKLDLDTKTNSLYLRITPGLMASTVEHAELVVADLDETGTTLGIEFVHAEDFASFVGEHPELVRLPSRLVYDSLDRGTSWTVENGVGDDRPLGERAAANARLHGAFVATLMADPALLDQIPAGATATIATSGGGADHCRAAG